MKMRLALFALVFSALFSGCALGLPAAPASTPLPQATATGPTPTPTLAPTLTPTPTDTATSTLTLTPTEVLTPTVTLTSTPFPTRKSPYPVGPGTPLPDLGFPPIDATSTAQLGPVFAVIGSNLWQSAVSRDGKELFVANSDGMVVYDRQATPLFTWPSVMTFDLSCESCLSVNNDGSRFALVTRKDGAWKAQVYNVSDGKLYLLYEQPLAATFQGVADEARVALSPDGLLLAYGAADGSTAVLDLSSLQQVYSYPDNRVTALVFTPDGASLAMHRGRDLLFVKTATWAIPVDLLLPAADSPYAFSPDGKLVTVAASTSLRTYRLDKMTPGHEVVVPLVGATTRTWQLTFTDATTLLGYGLHWDAGHTQATVDIGQWNAETGEQLKLDTTQPSSPDALSALWGAAIPSASAPADIEIGQYRRFIFVTQDSLLVDGIHTACWLKLSTGEKSCFNDPVNGVLASDVVAYREVLQTHGTVLQEWSDKQVFSGGPYRVIAVNRDATFVILNVKNFTTDIYWQPQLKLVESIPGTLTAFAEYSNLMAFATNKAGLGYITLKNKDSFYTVYRKQDRFFLPAMAMDTKGRVYVLQQNPDHPDKITLRVIAGPDYALADVATLTMPAAPQVMAIASATGMFAFGLQDGSVQLVSADGQESALIQAAYSPIQGLTFTPDGRYLGVASAEGIKVLAVLP